MVVADVTVSARSVIFVLVGWRRCYLPTIRKGTTPRSMAPNDRNPQDMAPNACPSCDTPLTDGAAFCARCGLATPTEIITGDRPSTVGVGQDTERAEVTKRLGRALGNRYHIERELGRGGMATVFLAEDLRHRRPVAIKVLNPELAHAIGPGRFLQEIKFAANLTHPNILPVHDSGDADGLLWYAMPYAEGESLRDRLKRERQLPTHDVIEILRDVADALAHAHSLGVVHRDIKPENILMSGGQPVVSDFGIARAVDTAGTERLTETGLAIGTPAYMSPEQAAGDRSLDGRSDIYSLGCMAYEMLGGEPPFTGPTPQAVLARHSVDAVPRLRTLRPTVSAKAERAIEKALAKVPADRFSTARQFAAELAIASTEEVRAAEGREHDRVRRTRTAVLAAGVLLFAAAGWFVTSVTAGPTFDRLAVLPPANLMNTPDQEHIVQGMPGVTLIGGLQSMLRYRDTDKTVREIAEELGVDAVIESSVFWQGDSVGIDARLIHGDTEQTLWSQSYEEDARNVLVLFRQVTRAIAGEVRVALTPQAEAHLAAGSQVVPEALEAYLQGRFYSGNLTQVDLENAIDYFNLALEKDPRYAPAYAGLSWAWIARQQMGYVRPSEATPLAVRAAERALELDSLLAEGHHALATARGWAGWDWELSERGLLRAIELNSGYGDARVDYSHLLLVLKRWDESEAQADSALESDPFNVKFQAFRGVVYMITGQHDKGFAEFDKVLRTVPNHPVARSVLGDIYHEFGRFDEALENVTAMYAAEGMPGFADGLRSNAAALGYHAGMRAAADEMAQLAEEVFVPPIMIASLYAYAAAPEQTLDWLEKGLASREPNLPYIGVSAPWGFVSEDPRFKALLANMNLPWALNIGR